MRRHGPPVAALRRRGELLRPREGDALVSVSVGCGGEAVALWADHGDLPLLVGRHRTAAGASFPQTLVTSPPPVRITMQGSGPTRIIEVPALDIAFPTVQPLPEHRFLIVGSRCALRPEGPEQNAMVVDDEGRARARTTVGDGIEHALATPTGRVWLGFFDEGVYGNLGWGPGGETPGSHGLVRLGPSLLPEWLFPFDADVIDDCYALNVHGEVAWACYYSSFAIARVEGDEVTRWRNGVSGASALIADGGDLALIGGYTGDRDRVVVGRLVEDQFVAQRTLRLRLPDHLPMPRATLVSRGQTLHAFVETTWYQLTLEDLLVV